MSSYWDTLTPVGRDQQILVGLCIGTIAIGVISFILTLLYYLVGAILHRDNCAKQCEVLCKPSCCEPTYMCCKGTISIILIFFELFFTALSFTSGLRPYSSILGLSSSDSVSIRDSNLRDWLYNGTDTTGTYPAMANKEGRYASFMAVITVVSLAYAIVAPYLLSFAFQLYAGQEIRFLSSRVHKGIRVIVKLIWRLGKLLLGWVLARVLVFFLTYYNKTIIATFILLPWELSLNTYSFFEEQRRREVAWVFGIWSFVVSVIVISCFTVQGFWAAVLRSVIRITNSKHNIQVAVKNLENSMQRTNIIGKMCYVSVQGVKFVIIFLFALVIHIIKVIIGYPEPQVFQLPPPCFLCAPVLVGDENRHARMTAKQMAGLIFCPQFYVSGETKKDFFDIDNPPPALIEWVRFCSSYTLSFAISLPWAGPFIFLIGTMLSRSGFWLSPFWLYIQKGIRMARKSHNHEVQKAYYFNPVTDGQLNSTNIREARQATGARDLVVRIFFKCYDGIRDTDYINFVNAKADNGRVLRMLLMLAIPMIALLPIFIPDWRTKGFDIFGFLQFIRTEYFN